MNSQRTISLYSTTLTAREHQEMRNCIEKIRRLGIRDNRLTNLTDRMSRTLKKSARREGKRSADKQASTGTVELFGDDILNKL